MKLADMIKKGEGGQTILFVLTGYLLTWLWFIFLSAEIHYSLENGVSWIFSFVSGSNSIVGNSRGH